MDDKEAQFSAREKFFCLPSFSLTRALLTPFASYFALAHQEPRKREFQGPLLPCSLCRRGSRSFPSASALSSVSPRHSPLRSRLTMYMFKLTALLVLACLLTVRAADASRNGHATVEHQVERLVVQDSRSASQAPAHALSNAAERALSESSSSHSGDGACTTCVTIEDPLSRRYAAFFRLLSFQTMCKISLTNQLCP